QPASQELDDTQIVTGGRRFLRVLDSSELDGAAVLGTRDASELFPHVIADPSSEGRERLRLLHPIVEEGDLRRLFLDLQLAQGVAVQGREQEVPKTDEELHRCDVGRTRGGQAGRNRGDQSSNEA